MEDAYKKKKLLFLEPVQGRSEEELTQAIIKQLKSHSVRINKKKNM